MNMIHRKDMRIRDPFLVTDRENRCYYLVMNGGTVENKHPNDAVFLRRTEDLIHFEDPFPILRLDVPAKGQCWAPEIHFYKGAWYLFTTVTKTMKGSGVDTGTLPFEETRGTAVFRSDSLTGPYEKWSGGPLTPPETVALDGTFFVDKSSRPWMVYCHEWIQIHDGTVEAVPLTEDLKRAAGEPILLFRGSEAPWTKPDYIEQYNGVPIHDETYVTDGPFLFYDASGALCTLWSPGGASVYKTGVVRSLNGTIEGPWEHCDKPLYENDGGHGMLFRDLMGRLILSIHQPNKNILSTDERLHLFPAHLTEDGLSIDLEQQEEEE